MKLRKQNQLKQQKELHRKNSVKLFDNVNEMKEEKKSDTPPPYASNPEMKPLKNGIECSVLTTVRVSDVFGYILCYSNQTRDIFLYSSNDKLFIITR